MNIPQQPEVKDQVNCWVAIIGRVLETLVSLAGIVTIVLGFLDK